MGKLVIKNLPENRQLDRQALAEFKGGFNPSRLLEQIAMQQTEAVNAASGYTLDQEPELGVSPKLSSFGLLQNQPFTPHS